MVKVELLIELVKKHKILYDLADEDYKNDNTSWNHKTIKRFADKF